MIIICVVITIMSESQKSKAKPLTPVWAGILRQEKVNQSARKPELLPFKCKYHGNTELHRFATISHLKKHLASVHHEELRIIKFSRDIPIPTATKNHYVLPSAWQEYNKARKKSETAKKKMTPQEQREAACSSKKKGVGKRTRQTFPKSQWPQMIKEYFLYD